MALSVVLLTAGPASAAPSEQASCVGLVVAPLASTGALDVDDFKALARESGARNFGAFVAGGAQAHLGSPAACLE
jgi:hypothetical protein